MKYDTGVFVIAAPSAQAARDAMLQYGVLDAADEEYPNVTVVPTIITVTTYSEARIAIFSLSADTPWVEIDGISPSLRSYMQARFGPATTLGAAMRALNDEFAVSPKKLSR